MRLSSSQGSSVGWIQVPSKHTCSAQQQLEPVALYEPHDVSVFPIYHSAIGRRVCSTTVGSSPFGPTALVTWGFYYQDDIHGHIKYNARIESWVMELTVNRRKG